MKACAGLAGVIVGLALVVVAALLLVPRLKAGPNGSKPPPTRTAQTGDRFAPAGDPVQTPGTEEERMRQEIAKKRVPFFHMIHERYPDQIVRAQVLDSIDTLDLQVKTDDPQTIQWIVGNAVGPTAHRYGFKRVRFYLPNPVGSVEPFRVVAESSWDGTSRWNTFLK